jgi:hypothetical protein
VSGIKSSVAKLCARPDRELNTNFVILWHSRRIYTNYNGNLARNTASVIG